MADVEQRLRALKLFKSSPNHPSKMAKRENKKPRDEKVFLTEANKDSKAWAGGFVQDDHVPFMQRGVDILHIIPSPFPRVWHEMIDDGEHLDIPTVEDWALLVTAFVAEWMDLEGHFDVKAQERKVYERKTEL
jgi:hypothetical protein